MVKDTGQISEHKLDKHSSVQHPNLIFRSNRASAFAGAKRGSGPGTSRVRTAAWLSRPAGPPAGGRAAGDSDSDSSTEPGRAQQALAQSEAGAGSAGPWAAAGPWVAGAGPRPAVTVRA
jgi:hypothetical protein